MLLRQERISAVESALEQLRELVTSLSIDETEFLTNNSVAYRRLWHTFRASLQVELTACQHRVTELEGLLASHEQQLESEQISKGSLIRELSELKQSRDCVVIPLDDSSRIQWLENNLPRLGAVGRAPSGTWQIFTEDETLSVGESLREAIDTAMQSNLVVRKSSSLKGWLKLLGPLFNKKG